jgi:hypothetical protein
MIKGGRAMTKEQARARITRLYEMIYYAQLMECKAAKITAQYYEETMEALKVAAEALDENTVPIENKRNYPNITSTGISAYAGPEFGGVCFGL